VVSLFVVSVLTVVSVLAGALILVESTFVLSLPLAALLELQPAAIDPTIVAMSAKLKTCFFIGI